MSQQISSKSPLSSIIPFACIRRQIARTAFVLALVSEGLSIPLLATEPTTIEKDDGVVKLSAFKVTGQRLEDFGFRVSHDFDSQRSQTFGRVYTPVVDLVLPHTAASKAGIRPGDRIIASDGESCLCSSSSLQEWRAIQKRKWSDVTHSVHGVSWTLQVETAGSEELRTVILDLPTPPPHWGTTRWRAPKERSPVAIPESGPLAERAEEILNNGIWTLLRGSYVRGLQLPANAAQPHFLCYQWTLWEGDIGHRMFVSHQRGQTDIIFEVILGERRGLFQRDRSKEGPERNISSETTVFANKARAYLTSPSGELVRACILAQQKEISLEAARAGFEAEVDFWLNKVGKVSPMWPLEVLR